MLLPPANPSPIDPLGCWRHRQPRKGEDLIGRLAGPPVGAWVHNEKQENGQFWSKPCRFWATKGRVTCRHQLCRPTQRFQAYVPLLTAKERIVVILGAKMFRLLKTLPVGVVLQVVAANRKGQSTSLKVIDQGQAPLLALPPVPVAPHDISEYLLRILWKDLPLWRYLSGPFRVQAGGPMPAELESETLSVTPPPSSAEMSSAPRSTEEQPAVPVLGDFLADIGPAPESAERNGRHPRPRKR